MKNVDSKRDYGKFELLVHLEIEPSDEFSQDIVNNLSLLKTKFKYYFPGVTCCVYITNPSSVDLADLPVRTGNKSHS